MMLTYIRHQVATFLYWTFPSIYYFLTLLFVLVKGYQN